MVLNIYHTGDSDTSFELAGIGEELIIVNETKNYDELKKAMGARGLFPGSLSYELAFILYKKAINLIT